MTIAVGTHELGPEDGTVLVKTYREGMAQAVGHDLVIDVTRWHATVTVGDGGVESIAFDADPDSLQVREGLRGVKPLSDKDRADIAKSIDEKILRREPISFRSTSVTTGDGGLLTVTGELTIAGTARQTTLSLIAGEGFITATLPVVQTEHKIKPYTAFFGALKVRDELDVVIDVRVPS